jgi:RNA polymerase sigma factor (sigma-70 family)
MPVLNKKEFEELYIKNYRVVQSCVARFIGRNIPLFSHDECEDLINDVFIAVHGAWLNFDGKCSNTTYLVAVAKKCLQNELRKRIGRKEKDKVLVAHQQQPEIPIKDLEKGLKEEMQKSEAEQYIKPESRKEPAIDLDKFTVRSEARAVIKELIQEIQKQDKRLADVINLYWLGFTDREIGERLNIPGKTISHWRIKAFESFKRLLKKRGIKSLEDILEV